jgi:DNA modification methylase
MEQIEKAIILGDATEVLKTLPTRSIHLTFTSPPYFNAKEYSTYPSYEAYLEFLKGIFEQVRRVTKVGRFLVVNTSPVIEPRISRAHSSKRYGIPFDLHSILVNGGWDFIDDIVWEKPAASVKNRIGGFLQHRKPLAYKPNCVTEYLMVYRKHTDKLIDWNIRQYDKETVEKSLIAGDFEQTNVWKISPKSSKTHPAVFPEELCKRVISYYSMQGDLVLDPFAGSGTLAKAAHELNRKFLLIEKEPKYFALCQNVLRTTSKNREDA